jgi:transcriptional regulator with XRE-family HTH domain
MPVRAGTTPPGRDAATRLRECLEALRWSQRELAAALGCNDRLVRRWTVGAPSYAVPESVGEWLELLATTHIRHPPPAESQWG